MAKPINLGRKWEDMLGPINRAEKDSTHYPDIYISDVDDPRLLEMPDEGEATIKFRVVDRTHAEYGRDGKKERRCSVRLEVISIEPPEKKSKSNNGDWGNGARKSFSDYFKDK